MWSAVQRLVMVAAADEHRRGRDLPKVQRVASVARRWGGPMAVLVLEQRKESEACWKNIDTEKLFGCQLPAAASLNFARHRIRTTLIPCKNIILLGCVSYDHT